MADVQAETYFSRSFGREPTAVASAPGRVNLIGEHTDYHQGFVLPMPIPQRTVVSVRRRADYQVVVASANASPQTDSFTLGEETSGRGWLDYIQGATCVLMRSGSSITGFDAGIESTVPAGGGVSSSAALLVAMLRALRSAFGLVLPDLEVAKLAQRAETEFVGAPVGIMDPMACSLGHADEALFIDTRSLAYERIPWPSNLELIVIDSGLSHAHAGGEYVIRRRESFSAAASIGVRWLRDATPASLAGKDLSDLGARRARHVITENARVLEAVEALRNGDPVRLGALFNQSHASMRDDYQVSAPAIDILVELGQHDNDIYGARLTGGGFGGAVVMLARSGTAAAAGQRIAEGYRNRVGLPAAVLVPVAAARFAEHRA